MISHSGVLFVSGPEYQEKQKLEDQFRVAEESLKYKKKLVQELQQDLQVISIYSHIVSSQISNIFHYNIQRSNLFVLCLEYMLQRSAKCHNF